MYTMDSRVVGQSTGAAVQRITLPRPQTDGKVRWTLIVARTSDTKARRIVICQGTSATWALLVDKTPAYEYDSVSVHGTVILPANALISADFYGVNAGKALELYAYGYKVD